MDALVLHSELDLGARAQLNGVVVREEVGDLDLVHVGLRGREHTGMFGGDVEGHDLPILGLGNPLHRILRVVGGP